MAQPTTETAPPTKSTAKPARPTGWRWIVNNEERIRILVLRGVMSPVSRLPQPGARIELGPGANIVDGRVWAEWKEQNADRDEDGVTIKGQASQLLEGEIPDGGHRHRQPEKHGQHFLIEGPAIKSSATPLADLDEKEAIRMVSHILDEAALKRQLQIERRPAVSETLRAKLDGLRRSIDAASAGI